jgi:hypothetical protein
VGLVLVEDSDSADAVGHVMDVCSGATGQNDPAPVDAWYVTFVSEPYANLKIRAWKSLR